ncbi:MAG: hypothetical protein IJV31_05490 [Clostridia bacterium]|nr:hypothetical protein [Clostridia bacterium]
MDFANGSSEILIDELNKNIQEIKGLEENTLINKLPTIVTINDVQYEIEYDGEVVKLNTLLPEGYVGVEYIEGNGRQNIDLGMKGNNHLVYQIKFLQKEYYGGVTVGVYNWVGNGPYDDQRLFMTGGNLLLDWVHSVRLSKEYDNLLNVVHNYEFGNRYVKDLETNELLLNGSLYETEFETNNNIIIGGAALQVYSLKIFDNGKIVRNMKPCRRTADNKVGMYDLVEDKFYSSNSTTEYIAGNEI